MDAARTEDGGWGTEDDDEDGVRTETGSRGEGGGLHYLFEILSCRGRGSAQSERWRIREFGMSGDCVYKEAVDVMDLSDGTLPFIKIIRPGEDGAEYDADSPFDAALDLSQGTPRFYIMKLPHRGDSFDRITYHAEVTQCLASTGVDARPWFIGVAAPTFTTAAGPDLERDVTVLRVPPGVILKMDKGTWHAGPLFEGDHASFFNLELHNTNVVDHNTFVYACEGGSGRRCVIRDLSM